GQTIILPVSEVVWSRIRPRVARPLERRQSRGPGGTIVGELREARRWHAPERTTPLAGLLAERAAATPDETCLRIEGAGPISYRELQENSARAAAGLLELGVREGSCVATLLENCAEGVYTWFGANMLGAIYVPINTAFRGPFLVHQLLTCQATVLVTEQAHLPVVSAVESEISKVVASVVVVDGRGPSVLTDVRTLEWVDLTRDVDLSTVHVAGLGRWDQPALCTFTSGTTGLSKGVVLSNQYVFRFAEMWVDCLDIRPGDVMFTGLPLFHMSGTICSIVAPIVGRSVGVLDRGFSASRFWSRANEVGATQTLLLGSMLQMLWTRDPDADEQDNSLRVIFAAPVPSELHRPMEQRYEVTVATGYGLSEAGAVVLTPHYDDARPGWAGRATPTCEVIVADEEDLPVKPGEVGEILVRPLEPHAIFDGYFGDPAASQRAWRNLWFHTGDLARMDADGYLQFVDRGKDYLRRRGENISSFEVEAAIRQCSAVAEVAVVGVPSEM